MGCSFIQLLLFSLIPNSVWGVKVTGDSFLDLSSKLLGKSLQPPSSSSSSSSSSSFLPPEDDSMKLPTPPSLPPPLTASHRFDSVGAMSLLEQSSSLSKEGSLEEQLNKLIGKAPPPFPPLPHTLLSPSTAATTFSSSSSPIKNADVLVNDATDEVEKLESALQKEELQEEEEEKHPPKKKNKETDSKLPPLLPPSSSSSSSSASSSSSSDTLRLKQKTNAKEQKNDNNVPQQTEKKEESQQPSFTSPFSSFSSERYSSPFLTPSNLFDLDPASRPSSSVANMRLLETKQTSLGRLNEQEIADQKLLRALTRKARESLAGANKLARHAEIHLNNLQKAQKQLNDEVALLSLKEQQMLQDKKDSHQDTDGDDDTLNESDNDDNESGNEQMDFPSSPESLMETRGRTRNKADVEDTEDFRG